MSVAQPEKRCISATRVMQDALMVTAEHYMQTGDFDAALVTHFRAYALRPGVPHVLQSIALIYDAMGDSESALLCRRGVVPESAEIKFFNSSAARMRLISARRAANNQHHKIHNPEKVALPLPTSNTDSQLRPEFRVRHTESRGNFISVLEHGALWFDGYNTLIKDSANRILKEHVKGNSAVVADISRNRAEKRVTGTACFIDARSSSIYYHWMMDVLPKIALVQKSGIDLHSIDHFIVNCESDFQQQTLQHLGICPTRIITIDVDKTIRVDKLIVPYLKHDRGDRIYNGLGLGMARWVPAWLSRTFVSRASHEPATSKVYLSRSKRGTRAPVDEARLVEALGQRGFTSVTLEDLSVVQQANLLASASIVVAPHGAGLTNIAFCKPGTMVVEIFGDYVVPCYWALSALANLNYHHYLAPEAYRREQTTSSSVDLNSKDKQVPVTTTDGTKVTNFAVRRSLGIELDVDDFMDCLDTWMQTKGIFREAGQTHF